MFSVKASAGCLIHEKALAAPRLRNVVLTNKRQVASGNNVTGDR